MTTRLRFGIKTAQQWATYPDLLRIWREADNIPVIEHAWLFDHFISQGVDSTGPCLEGWTLLSALATETVRLRLGILVTSNTYRQPALLAKMGATVDRISEGRLDFGIGAGWNEAEHTAYGIPLYTPSERLQRLEEACEIIKRLWREKITDFDGKHYQVHGAHCEPKPMQQPHPPIIIGGRGEKRTLRVAAQHANVWNIMSRNIEEFRHKSAVLDGYCVAIGRDPTSIERSVQVAVKFPDLEVTRQIVDEYICAGARHIVLDLHPPYPGGMVARVAQVIVEPLLAAHAFSA